MQIDWISAITTTPPTLWPGYTSGSSLLVGPDGELLSQKSAPHQVLDDEPSSSKNFRVWTPDQGSLYLSGNPAKLLQGHNLWGSMDAYGYFLEAGQFIRRCVGLFPGHQTWESCQFTRPRFTRIDITRSYRFGSEAEALDYVRYVAGTAKTRHGAAKLYESGTAYFGQHSKRWTLKIYAKRQELEHTRPNRAKRFLGVPDLSPELYDWASGVVRFELTLRSLQLASHPSVDLFDPLQLESLWFHYFDTVQFNENSTMATRTDATKLDLPPRLFGVVALWNLGNDMRSLYPRKTFYRYRTEILSKTGIDISVPPTDLPPPTAPRVALDPAGWDPAPIAGGIVEPDPQLKLIYPFH